MGALLCAGTTAAACRCFAFPAPQAAAAAAGQPARWSGRTDCTMRGCSTFTQRSIPKDNLITEWAGTPSSGGRQRRRQPARSSNSPLLQSRLQGAMGAAWSRLVLLAANHTAGKFSLGPARCPCRPVRQLQMPRKPALERKPGKGGDSCSAAAAAACCEARLVALGCAAATHPAEVGAPAAITAITVSGHGSGAHGSWLQR